MYYQHVTCSLRFDMSLLRAQRVQYVITGKNDSVAVDRIAAQRARVLAMRRSRRSETPIMPPRNSSSSSMQRPRSTIWHFNKECLLLPARPRQNHADGRKKRKEWKKQLTRSLDLTLHKKLQCHLAKRMANAAARFNIYPGIYFVEKRRHDDRQLAKSSPKTSVILFMCQSHDPMKLQSRLNPYVWCAYAVKNLAERYNSRYRIIICNSRANPSALADTATQQRVDISNLDIALRPNIQSYAQMEAVVREVDPRREEIALAYISSHGGENELFFGQWYDGMGASAMREDSLRRLCGLLYTRKSADMQVFCNSCWSNTKTAPFMAARMPGTIVIGADDTIPTDKILHAFEIDAWSKRLYFSVNSADLNMVQLFANIRDDGTPEDPPPEAPASAVWEEIVDLTTDELRDVMNKLVF